MVCSGTGPTSAWRVSGVAKGRARMCALAFTFVNNRAHTLVVLVLCIFGTCRAFRLAEVFLTRCLFVKFSCAPVFVCLKGP